MKKDDVLIGCAIVALTLICGFFVADCLGGNTEKIDGIVVSRSFAPAHSRLTTKRIPMGTTTDGKGHTRTNWVTVPWTERVPDAWHVAVQYGGNVHEFKVSQAIYTAATEGRQVFVTESVGRWSGFRTNPQLVAFAPDGLEKAP